MPVKMQDTVPVLDKEGNPKYIIGPNGPVLQTIPTTKEYEVVYVQNVQTGEVLTQSTKAARMFYGDRGQYRFLKPEDGARIVARQKAAALGTDGSGFVNFADFEEDAREPLVRIDDEEEDASGEAMISRSDAALGGSTGQGSASGSEGSGSAAGGRQRPENLTPTIRSAGGTKAAGEQGSSAEPNAGAPPAQ
jgi:hypothetical protein